MSDDTRKDYGPAGACRRKAAGLVLLFGTVFVLCGYAVVRAIREQR